MVARFVGPFFKAELLDKEWFPENAYYDYLRVHLPDLIYDNPRAIVTSKRGQSQRDVAQAIKFGLDRWAVDVNLQETLTDACRDMLMMFGVVMTVNEPVTASKIEERWELTEAGFKRRKLDGFPRRPRAYRLSQRRWAQDPLALEPREARFQLHKFVRSRSEIIAEAESDPDSGWNLKMLRQMTGGDAAAYLKEFEGKQTMERDEIIGWEVWVPEHGNERVDEGFHGKIYTLAEYTRETAGVPHDYLRAPRDYYGPEWGPYTLFGVFRVPDEIYPLSPLVATEGQIRELNKHAKALSANAAERKKVGIYDQTDAVAADLITNARDGQIIGIPGARKDLIFDIEVGGVSPEQIQFYQLLLDRMERATGLHEARRGAIPGNATATAVAVAEQAVTSQIGFIKKQFAGSVVQVLRTAAWFMYHDDRVIFPLGEEASKALGIPEPMLQGGNFEPGSGLTFDDLELVIEPLSMERASEGLQASRMADLFNFLVQVAPGMPQMPWVNWERVFDDYGDSRNYANFSRVLKLDVIAQMTGQEAQAPSQPSRLAGDLGQAGLAQLFQQAQAKQQGGQQTIGQAQGGLPGQQTGAVAKKGAALG